MVGYITVLTLVGGVLAVILLVIKGGTLEEFTLAFCVILLALAIMLLGGKFIDKI